LIIFLIKSFQGFWIEIEVIELSKTLYTRYYTYKSIIL